MEDTYVQKLNWDTEFFNIKVGSIDISHFNLKEIDEVMKKAQNSLYRLVYLFDKELNAARSEMLVSYNGCELVDTKIVFYKDLGDAKIYKENCRDFLPTDDLDNLYFLALESGKYSRYKLDLNFNYTDFERLYRTWIDKSISGQIADKFIVYELKNRIIGFVSFRYQDKLSQIGLIAVAPEARGMGVGKQLIACVEALSLRQGCIGMMVATQEKNQIACSFYKQLNMIIKEKINIYHLWIQ